MQEPDPEWYIELNKEGTAPPEQTYNSRTEPKADNDSGDVPGLVDFLKEAFAGAKTAKKLEDIFTECETAKEEEDRKKEEEKAAEAKTTDSSEAGEAKKRDRTPIDLGEYGASVSSRSDIGRLFFTAQKHNISADSLTIKEHLPKFGRFEVNPRGEDDDGSDKTKFRMQGAIGSLWDGPTYGNTWVSVAVDGEFAPGDRIVTFIGTNPLGSSIGGTANDYVFQYATFDVPSGLSDGKIEKDGITYDGIYKYTGELTVENSDESINANLAEMLKSENIGIESLNKFGDSLKKQPFAKDLSTLVVQDPAQRPEDQYFMKQDPSTLWAFRETAENGIYTLSKKYSDRLLTTFRLPITGRD